MKCVVCKTGVTKLGKTTVTLDRNNTTLVFKCVPAQVCANCGEAYVEEKITKQILKTAEKAAHAGVQVDVRQFAAA